MQNDSTPETTAVPAIDLDAPVTGEQFHAALQALWDYARTTLADRKSWCSAWVNYARGISERFPEDQDTVTVPALTDAESVPAEWLNETGLAGQAKRLGERYQAELKQIRARLLYWVNNGNLTLDEANEAFRRMGLPGYTPDPQLPNGYTLQVTLRFSTADAITGAAPVFGSSADMKAKLQEIYGSDTVQFGTVNRGSIHRDYDYQSQPVRREDTETPLYT
jgi:hypothetical protein